MSSTIDDISLDPGMKKILEEIQQKIKQHSDGRELTDVLKELRSIKPKECQQAG